MSEDWRKQAKDKEIKRQKGINLKYADLWEQREKDLLKQLEAKTQERKTCRALFENSSKFVKELQDENRKLEGKIEAIHTELFKLLKKHSEIVVLPNMGDEGRKVKMLAFGEWHIYFRKFIESEVFGEQKGEQTK